MEENYQQIFHVNMDADILNEILADEIQQCIKWKIQQISSPIGKDGLI